MAIQLALFLYIYYGFLVIWALLFLAVIYHMLKFGLKSFATFLLTFIFIAVAILLLNVSYIYLSQVDWSKMIVIWGNFSSSLF